MKDKEVSLKAFELDILHQINCFMKLELGYANNKLIKIPQKVKF